MMLRREDIKTFPIRILIPHYLLASFCYYQLDKSPMTDDAFDYLCQRILANYDRIQHEHKRLVDRESLEAGTCLLPVADYPARVQAGVHQYFQLCESRTIITMIEESRSTQGPTSAPAIVRRVARRTKPAEAPAPRRIVRRSRG